MRRELFLAVGGFDAQRYRRPAIEDIELGTWVSASGHKIILDSRIKAKHLKRWTLWSLLKIDIFDRGIPWVRLMLRAGTVANTLNVKHSQRLSVVLVYLMGIAVLAAVRWPVAWSVALLLALAVLAINRDFYRYFVARAGLGFALRAVPLHWLYFGYCGVCVLWGTLQHYLEGESGTPVVSSQPPGSD